MANTSSIVIELLDESIANTTAIEVMLSAIDSAKLELVYKRDQ